MILDRFGLGLLLDLSSRVEEVSVEAVKVREALTDPGTRTPEESLLGEIVSGLEGVERTISSLVSRYPEEAVLLVKKEREEDGL